MSHLGLGAGEYRLRVGTATLGLRLRPRRFQTVLARYFGRPGASSRPDCRLRVRVVDEAQEREMPESLFLDKQSTSRGFSVARGLVQGRRLPGSRGLELRLPAMLLEGQLIRVFEQLLYQAFYDAARTGAQQAVLVHAAGVIRDGEGYLFLGPSGSGKSTVAELSREHSVLNDEICELRFAGHRVELHDTPFNGFFTAKQEGSAPLRAVLLLRHGEVHRLLPAGRAEAAAAIFREIVPPVGVAEPIGAQTHRRMLEVADRLVGAVPVRRLEFLRDEGFWDTIREAIREGGLR